LGNEERFKVWVTVRMSVNVTFKLLPYLTKLQGKDG